MESEPCDGSTLTDDELDAIEALELQFATDEDGEDGDDDESDDGDDGAPAPIGWRARVGLGLWATGGVLAIASIFGAAPLRAVAAAVTVAGFLLIVTEV